MTTADQAYLQADVMPAIFVQRYLDSSPNDRSTSRTARITTGWSAFHRLAEHHGREMCRLLEAIEASEAVEILGIVNTANAERTSVSAFLFRQNQPPEVIRSVVDLCLARPAIRNALKDIRSGGWTAFHYLSEHHGRELCRLLEAVEASEAVEILGIVNTANAARTSVASFLYKHPLSAVDLCLARPAIRNALKDIRHDGWTAFHNLAEHHGGELCRLLEAIEASEAVEILGIVNTTHSHRRSVASFLWTKFRYDFIRLHLGRDLCAGEGAAVFKLQKLDEDLYFVSHYVHDLYRGLEPGRLFAWHTASDHPTRSPCHSLSRTPCLEMQGVLKILSPTADCAIEMIIVLDADNGNHRTTILLHMAQDFRDLHPSDTFCKLLDFTEGGKEIERRAHSPSGESSCAHHV